MMTGTLSPVSNRATWLESMELVDVDNGEPVDLSGLTEITIVVRDPRTDAPQLTLTLTNGDVMILDTGVFGWRADAGNMTTLVEGMYEVGCTVTDGVDTAQLVIGYLPVLDGIVT